LPVCDVDHKVLGTITDRDIVLRVVAEGKELASTTVEQVMTRDVASVSPGSDAAEAEAIMQKRGVRRVPIIDGMGRVHGVVTFDDLFRNLSHEADTLMDAVMNQTVHIP
jgi:CBS domain-containing protein